MKHLLSGLRGLLGRRPAASPAPSPSSTSATSPSASPGTLINVYATLATLPPLSFGHVLHARRDLSDPELAPHLRGFRGYVTAQGDGAMTRTRYHVLRHIARVQQHLSLSVTDDQLDAFGAWSLQANAISFLPDGSVRDPAGRVLVTHGSGPVDPESAVPYPADAVRRAERTRAALADRGLDVPAHLPPREGEHEAQWRTPAQVWGRTCALAVVAVRADSVRDGDPLPIDLFLQRLPAAFEHLSPEERAFLADDAPSAEDVVKFGWRYECAQVLAWALGLIDALPFPSAICDAAAVTNAIITTPAMAAAQARLRPAPALLDAMDLHFRAHWLVRQRRLDGKGMPDGLDAGVLQERHLALNWLVGFDGAPWDDVDTPT
jgi:hypothetical protein